MFCTSCTPVGLVGSSLSASPNTCTSVFPGSKDAVLQSLSETTGAYTLRSGIGGVADREIRAIRMLEHERTDTGLRIHHESLGQLDANFFGPQQLPNRSLIVEVRARRITKTVALAPIARSKSLRHRHFRRIT